MSVWLTADLHLGHRFVAAKRGFADDAGGVDVAAHDAMIAAHWDATVKTGDVVWVLGDLALRDYLMALDWIADRPGTKRLILGNHDPAHPMHGRAHLGLRHALTAFDFVAPFAKLSVGGREVLLSHFPYEGDTPGRDGDRERQFRLRDYGVPILHGHTHDPSPFSLTARMTPQIHVGWDAHRRFLEVSQIAAMLDNHAAHLGEPPRLAEFR